MIGIPKGALHRPIIRFGIAIVAAAVGFLLHQVLLSYAGPGLPLFITFYPAVMLVGILCGFWAGLLATATASLLVAYWYLPPLQHFAIHNVSDAVALAFFLLMGTFMSLVSELYRRYRRKAEAYAKELALRESQEALRQSQERLRLAVESAELGTWDLNPVTGQLKWSDRCKAVFGLPPDARVDYQTFLDRLHPEDRQRVDKIVQEALDPAGTGEYDIEFRSRWPDGTERRIIATGKAFFDIVDGKRRAVRFIGMVQDITERKRAGDEQLSQAVRVAGLGVFNYDHITDKIQWSPEMREMCGWGVATEPGLREWIDLIHPEDRAKIGEAIQRVHTPAGERVPVLLNGMVVTGADGVRRIWSLVTDITARKQAEAALRQRERRLKAIFNQQFQFMAILAPNGTVLEANETCFSFTGVRRDEVIGHLFWESRWWNRLPEAQPVWQQNIAQVASGGGTSSGEIVYSFADGSVHFVHYAITGLREETNGVTSVMVEGSDITERKAAEAALERTIEELTRSNKDLEQFAYVASHDLQEPLRMVTSFMSLLQKRCQGQLDSAGLEYIQYASEGATRMQNLVAGLLAYSRVGRKEEAFAPVDCNVVLQSVLSNLQASITESGAVITCDTLPTIQADRTELTQLFQNLLGNAIKFRAEGRRPEIHVGAIREDGQWKFHVEDNGIGIESRFQERIFLIFQRLHMRQEYPGVGIGLSICKRIVERHHGRIWLESEVGRGTTFYFTIPIKKATQRE